MKGGRVCCPCGKIELRPMHRDMRDKGGSGEPSAVSYMHVFR